MIPPNDWEIRKCLVLCSSLFVAVLALIELGNLGFDLPVLRQLAGFLFLAIVPGISILFEKAAARYMQRHITFFINLSGRSQN
jgi:uncharacterized membrane protein